MGLSAPATQYLVAIALLFHTTTEDIPGLEPREAVVLRGMSAGEKRLVLSLAEYISKRKDSDGG